METTATKSTAAQPATAAVRILVVEDDPTISEVVTFQLTRAGHDVITAADGVAALQALRSNAPDLVVLDLMLPRMFGLDVLRLLRYDSSIPVIIISARDSEADKIAGFQTGADDYLVKPFSVSELVARVDAALRRASLAGGTREASESGPIDVDRARHEVRRRGEPVHLSPKEFELLVYLMDNAGRVCDREAILEAVWGYGYGGDTRTVDVHMHWLRQKLEDDPKDPRHLVTVRNYGYRFIPRPEQA